MNRDQKLILAGIAVGTLVLAAGCRKKMPVAVAPPAPEPVVAEPAKPNPPTISEFTAEPRRIERGQSALLKWQVKDATEIEINLGIGAVAASGRRQITPSESATYRLTAKGPGGTAAADTTISVSAPPPPPPPPVTRTPTLSERLSSDVQDAYFDFDRSELREDARAALTRDATALKSIMADFPATAVVIEGHCDERGSAEYNLALGDRRASAAKDFLAQLGVAAERLLTISYGKERPQCEESTESCWQKNRRAHFVAGEEQRTK